MFKFLKKIISPFSKLKSTLGHKLRSLFAKRLDADSLIQLESLFYEADLGSQITLECIETLSRLSQDTSQEERMQVIKEKLLSIFPPLPVLPPVQGPEIILFIGVNGSGKTTSLAKLAAHFQGEGKRVLMAAGDTFRAAAVEQLETWSQKLQIPLIKSQAGGDPAAVAFDAVTAAKTRDIEITLIDTAGRLQTKTDLMQELSKIRRVIQKQIPEAPHQTLLVLDATTGQNAIDQVKIFHQFTPITGIILTKLDGSAKGGIAAAIQKNFSIPILWVGTGESKEDLIPFNAMSYVNALLDIKE